MRPNDQAGIEEGRGCGRQLADEFRVSPAAIVPVCDRLERMGYLRRVRDTDDRRICWFELTDEGAGTLDIVSHNITSHIRPALRELSDEDRKALLGILDTLTKAMAQGRTEMKEWGSDTCSRV